jgi:hypothetical protein
MGLSTSYYTVDGEIIGESTNGTRLDYLTDALGSVTAKVNQVGSVASTARYKPYGDQLSGSTYIFGWVGSYGYRKAVNGSYVRARHYSKLIGAWTTVDPLWPEEHSYGYAKGNTSTYDDFTGFSCRMTKKDITVKLSTDTCTATCTAFACFNSWCRYDTHSSMTLIVHIGHCKGCHFYQWVSRDGEPFRRDSKEGWPYHWLCDGPPLEKICSTNDTPGENNIFTPCFLNSSSQIEFIACVCCDGSSECFRWGVSHHRDQCDPRCSQWGPIWLRKDRAATKCRTET